MSIAIAYEHRTTADVVAENIRAEAARAGFTQVALGRALGLSQGKITLRWKGQTRWQLDELDAVAELLNVSVQDLVTDHSHGVKQNPDRWIAPSGAAARSKGLEPPTFCLVSNNVVNLDDYRRAI